jgi:DNA-binding transcriptional regulator YiaG
VALLARVLAPEGNAAVTASLLACARYQPDLSAIACERVRLARQAAGATPAVFAARLSELLTWPVRASAVENWEAGKTAPPGDVLLAAFLLCADFTSPAPRGR